MLKRFVIWLVETLCQVPLLIALLLATFGLSQGVRLFELRLLLFAVLVFMVGSGYVVTTAIVGTFFRSRTPWLYPAITALLFIIHEQFFITGWELPTSDHIQIQAGGASLVFATTFVGGCTCGDGAARTLRQNDGRSERTGPTFIVVVSAFGATQLSPQSS